MSDIRIDDDGFLVGDGEQQRTEAENVLMREIKADTTTIVNLLKGTVKLQRETLKATQNNSSPKPNGGNNGGNNGSNNQQPKVNLVHPNRVTPTPSNAPTARPNQQGATNNNQSPNNSNSAGQGAPDTARINRQRDANGRFTSGDNAENTESNTQGRGNRDSRGRFTGGNGSGQNAAERSAVSRITDSLKDLNNTLNVNANTDRIDPTIDAIKELGSIANVGIDAGKKALSVSNTLIAKPAMALGRGIKGLFKPKTDAINSPVAWYKRIWRTLERGNRQDQTQHAQEQRRLDELVRGQGQRGSADSSFLMMLGLGIAALLAGISSLFKNFKWPDFPKFEWPWGDGDKNHDGSPVVKVPPPKTGAPSSRVNLNNPNRPPVATTPQTKWQKAVSWLKETKAAKAVSKTLPWLAPVTETIAGGKNAYDIETDQYLTPEQKMFEQKKNATRTAARIGGGQFGFWGGALLAGKLTAPTLNPWIIGAASLGGGVLGSIYGAEGAEKANDWFYGKKIEQSSTKAKIFVEPSAYVGNVYADKKSELYKNYQLWKEADTDGNGIITFEDFKKSKYVKQNPALLKKFEPVTPKKLVNDSTQANYQKYKPLLESVYSQKGFKDPQAQAFLKAQVQTESGFNPNAVSKKGAYGLTQFMPDTAKQYKVIKGESLAAVTTQVQGQADYMTVLLKRYGGDWDKALAAYNTGEGNLDKTLKLAKEKGVDWWTLLPKETKDYLVKIKNKALNYGVLTSSQIAAQSPTTTPQQPIAKAETIAPPTLKSAPVNAVPIQNVNAVAQVQAKESPTRINNTPTPIKVSIQKPIVSQNVSDRGIAHIVTGGIGEAM